MNPVVTITNWIAPLLPATEMGRGIAVGLALIIGIIALLGVAGATVWVMDKRGMIE